MTGDTTVSSPTTSPTRRGTRRRAAQEADWDLKGAEDARQLLYEREVAWKYGALTARAINAYWRTGTGKTHTLREALDRLVDRHAGPVEVRFLELSGKKDCRDLLNDGAPVKLLSDADEKIHFVGRRSARRRPRPSSGRARGGFATPRLQETERNAASSRSHAVVQVLAPDGRALTLVDLAGSERKWETMGMRSRAQNRESADINLSLMALKDCFRATHDGGRVPYRSSSLTRVLRTCFFDAEAVHLVATLSPSADDLIHSVYSVATACLMAPGLGDATRSTGRAARDGHEGAMWVVGADTDAALAREITNALKREACKWRLEWRRVSLPGADAHWQPPARRT
ncbi:hypothetical protein JL722_10854 [Aureococcus anophagefferens]|nr:hypothetical protein JL722_10854 [Aureococcus anophagefferens]